MESKSQQMEKMIEAHCQRLLHDIVSLNILDLVACFIFFIIMRWIENVIENRFLFLPALLLQFLLSYLLDKLCPKYITLILSYIYISMCKSILPKSILKIDFSLVTRNRGKVFFGISTCFVISASFLLEPSVRYYYFKNLAFFGFFSINNCLRREDEIDIKGMKLTIDDLTYVMQILCQFSSNDEIEEIGEQMMGYQELCALFEESEPSLDEVCEAFSIFDQDRDGFFDARDLQIVLIKLGLQGETNLNTCQHMIEQYDSGGGGKINSTDFCRLLETSLL
ncbi:calcium-binding protein CML45 [Carex littledalei]|uniref:Calcium-binding protein CML45 n=1 Tax=Carex littledalei TaxID=544730 RepID=A0A833VHC6_9POAL|nr:calcium-binding protein CML45 [Carex littledalei]